MKRSGARARPRVSYPAAKSPSNVWLMAAAASLVWVAAVLAFSWGRFALPGDPRSVLDAAQSRIEFSEWLMILASIAGPLLLIWVIAWLVRRSMELRDESRRLAKAAILLADAAETAEKRAETLLPAPDSVGGQLIAQGSGHFHREIERATHAMNALQTQMSSMELALAKQASAFDNAAEQAAAKTRALTAGTAGVGLIGAAGAAAIASDRSSDTLVLEAEDSTGDISSDVVVNPANAMTATASAVDLALEPQSDAERLRSDLASAARNSQWKKLVAEEKDETPAAREEKSLRDSIRADVAALKASTSESTPPIAPEPANDGGRIDPFDDLGPSAPKAAAGAALGAGVAMSFGATRDDDVAPRADVRLDTAPLSEPEPVAPAMPKAAPIEPAVAVPDKSEDFEFMARALDWRKFVRAANFPENESDTATLDALYDVLTDPEAAALLQSSEDTLATLADLDLYMEDFVPEMSPIIAWRAHLEGKPGVQGIEAPIEQSRILAKLTSDADFRKLAERFVERYQVILKRLFKEGADDRLALELADSRTGRAYLLVSGCLKQI